MKKTSLMTLITIFLSISFFIYSPVSAACYGRMIVDGKIYGCSDSSPWYGNEPVTGVTISIDNKKISLENYKGGPIGITSNDYGFSSAYEIELIGQNEIIAKPFSEKYNSEDYRYTDYNVAFFNITPTFTGSGTLTIINATIPFAFDNSSHNDFSIKIVGDNYSNNNYQQQTNQNSPTSTINKATQQTTSFFETTTGSILLIAIPSILIIVIIILSVVLFRKQNNDHNPIKDNDPTILNK